MSRNLQVLIVEDDAKDAELLVENLDRAGFRPHWTSVQTESDFLSELEKRPEIILSDYTMPKFSGLRALELLKESGHDIPLIIISGTIGEEVAVQAMCMGAVDYLLKGKTARLANAVERVLNEKWLRDERREAEERIRTQLRELQQWRDTTLAREERVQILKLEVNELLREAGKPPRYGPNQSGPIKTKT